jgi:Lyzozyme M1 (1,4-beta-N-acetylmuramidase)
MKRSKGRKIEIIVLAITLAVLIIVVVFIALVRKRIIVFTPSWDKYSVRGIDVSHYQGKIDWEKLSQQNIEFAFIKATEGSSCIDEKFSVNWKKAQETKLILGAYHFFSFDSDAKTQADNFIRTVGSLDGKLPPAVDVEFYGDKDKKPYRVKETKKLLKEYLNILEQHYGVKPIIYATIKSYDIYIRGDFKEYPLWIRNVYYSPQIDLNEKWTFWQYTDKALFDGIDGKEDCVDMNIYKGSRKSLEAMTKAMEKSK